MLLKQAKLNFIIHLQLITFFLLFIGRNYLLSKSSFKSTYFINYKYIKFCTIISYSYLLEAFNSNPFQIKL